MALLKIRDANGQVHEIASIKGNDYILTDADKREIAEMVTALMSVNAVSGDAPDLSLYALKTDIPDLTGYALKTDIPDLTGYALKSDIPDLTGYALKTDVPDVSKFMTEDEVLTLIQANMPVNGDEESY